MSNTADAKGKGQSFDMNDIHYLPGHKGHPRTLGEGKFFVVYLAKYNGGLIAVKKLKKDADNGSDEELLHWLFALQTEATILEIVAHQYIVKCLGHQANDRTTLLPTEYASGGDLYSLLQSRHPAVRWEVHGARMAHQIAQAVAHCHSLNVVNREIKSANVLLTSTYEVRVCDFTQAKRLPTPTSYAPHTPHFAPQWAPPEAFNQNGKYLLKSDIFSLGVVIWELLTQKQPWAGVPAQRIEELVSSGQRLEIPKECPNILTECLVRCFDRDPSLRPSALQVVEVMKNVVSSLNPKPVLQDFALAPAQLPVEYIESLEELLKQLTTKVSVELALHLSQILLGSLAVASALLPTDLIRRILDSIIDASKHISKTGFYHSAINLLNQSSVVALKFQIQPQASQIALLLSHLFMLPKTNQEVPTREKQLFTPVDKGHFKAIIRHISTVFRMNPITDSKNPPELYTAGEAALGRLEALVLAQSAHDLLLARLASNSLSDPPAAKIDTFLALVSKLVHSGLLDHAWALLAGALRDRSSVPSSGGPPLVFTQFHIDLTQRLAAIAPHLTAAESEFEPLQLPPALATSPLFPKRKPYFLEYKDLLAQNRSALAKAAGVTVPGQSTPLALKQISNDQFIEKLSDYSQSMRDVLARLFGDCQALLGPAPCQFAFAALGSIGSLDMCIYSDLELLLLLENPDAVRWENTSPPSAQAEYFQTLFNLIQAQFLLLGETNNLGPTVNSNGSGLHLDAQGHPGVELRLRGTPEQIIAHSKKRTVGLDDALTYSLMSPAYIFGNDKFLLFAEFEDKMFRNLIDNFSTSSWRSSMSHSGGSGTASGSSSPILSPVASLVAPTQSWQQAIVHAQMKFHNQQASDNDLLAPRSPTHLASIKLKTYTGALKYALFDLCRYHGLKATSVAQSLNSLSHYNIIGQELVDAATSFYAFLQKLRVRLHLHAGFQHDSYTPTRVGTPDDPFQTPILTAAEIDAVKLGVYGILQKVLFGVEFVLKEYDALPVGESAFPTEGPLAILVLAMESLIHGDPVEASDLEEIYTLVSKRQQSANRLCELNRIATQIHPKNSKLPKTVIRVNKNKVVESIMTGAKALVGTWPPVEFVWADSSGESAKKVPLVEFWNDLVKTPHMELRKDEQAWLVKPSVIASAFDLKTLGYILLRTFFDTERPVMGAISVPVMKYILQGRKALNPKDLDMPVNNQALDEYANRLLEPIKLGFLSVPELRTVLADLTPMDYMLFCNQQQKVLSSKLLDRVTFAQFPAGNDTEGIMRHWIATASSESLSRFLLVLGQTKINLEDNVVIKFNREATQPSSTPELRMLRLPPAKDKITLGAKMGTLLTDLPN